MKNIFFIIFLLLLSSGVALAGVDCNITGDGQLYSGDALEGSVITKKNGTIKGSWSHMTPDGNHLSGDVEWLNCVKTDENNFRIRKTIANIADIGGSSASWNGEEGYSFRVHIQDSGRPGIKDHYRIMVFNPAGEMVYRTDDIVDGNIQIHSKDL